MVTLPISGFCNQIEFSWRSIGSQKFSWHFCIYWKVLVRAKGSKCLIPNFFMQGSRVFETVYTLFMRIIINIEGIRHKSPIFVPFLSNADAYWESKFELYLFVVLYYIELYHLEVS